MVLHGEGEVRTRLADGTIATTPFPVNSTSIAVRPVSHFANLLSGRSATLLQATCMVASFDLCA